MSSKYRDHWGNAGGAAPESWDFVSIEDFLKSSKSISVGVMYPGESTPGGVPLVRVADVKDGAISQKPDFCVSEKVNYEYRRTQLNGDELLITLVGNPGDCVVATDEMKGWNAARAIAVLRLKDPAIRPWLRYVLLSKPAKHLIDARLNTTVQKTLNLKDIKELPIPLPEKDIRDSIVKIAQDLERKIVLNRQINQTLEHIAQAIFKSWFVDFEPVKAKIQAKQNGQDPERAAVCAISGKTDAELDAYLKANTPEHDAQGSANVAGGRMPGVTRQQLSSTAALFPDELEDSELGLIPKGWHLGITGDLFELHRGYDLPKKKRTEGKYLVYAAGGIHGTHNEYKIRPPGVITGRSGVIGNVYLSLEKYWPLNTTLYVREFRACGPYYAYHYLKSCDFQSFNSGSAVPSLNRNFVHLQSAIIPGAKLLEKFEKSATPIFASIKHNNDEMQTLTILRDALLPKLLSGDIPLNPISQEMGSTANG